MFTPYEVKRAHTRQECKTKSNAHVLVLVGVLVDVVPECVKMPRKKYAQKNNTAISTTLQNSENAPRVSAHRREASDSWDHKFTSD